VSAIVDVRRFVDLLGYKYPQAEIVEALETAYVNEKGES
jgi:hypothetical protein